MSNRSRFAPLRSAAKVAELGLLLAACGSSNDDEAGSSFTVAPTQATTTSRAQVTTTTAAVTTSTEATTTTSAVTTSTEATTSTTEAVVLAPLPPCDAAAGESLFNMPLEVRLNDACSTCHSTLGAERGWGPVLDGIEAVAGDRAEGLGADAYLHESIIAPGAYRLEGWQLEGGG